MVYVKFIWNPPFYFHLHIVRCSINLVSLNSQNLYYTCIQSLSISNDNQIVHKAAFHNTKRTCLDLRVHFVVMILMTMTIHRKSNLYTLYIHNLAMKYPYSICNTIFVSCEIITKYKRYDTQVAAANTFLHFFH